MKKRVSLMRLTLYNFREKLSNYRELKEKPNYRLNIKNLGNEGLERIFGDSQYKNRSIQ